MPKYGSFPLFLGILTVLSLLKENPPPHYSLLKEKYLGTDGHFIHVSTVLCGVKGGCKKVDNAGPFWTLLDIFARSVMPGRARPKLATPRSLLRQRVASDLPLLEHAFHCSFGLVDRPFMPGSENRLDVSMIVVKPETAGFSSERLENLRALLQGDIGQGTGRCGDDPGAAWKRGGLRHVRREGHGHLLRLLDDKARDRRGHDDPDEQGKGRPMASIAKYIPAFARPKVFKGVGVELARVTMGHDILGKATAARRCRARSPISPPRKAGCFWRW